MSSVTKANYVDSEQLEQLVNDEKLVVLDFTATWCGPCKVVAPIIDRLAKEYSDRATIVKVDIDQNKESAKKYGIRSIPAIIVSKNGEIVETLFGSQPYETYRDILETQIKV